MKQRFFSYCMILILSTLSATSFAHSTKPYHQPKESTMTDLTSQSCKACEGGVKPLSKNEASDLLKELKAWELSEDAKTISKRYRFKNFYQTMSFVNAIAFIANQENHHPDMELGYNYCLVKFQTHAIEGLSKNDFICAAKIDHL